MSLEDLKQQIQEKASTNPEKFFPVKVLEQKGFSRGSCEICDRKYWSLNDRKVCGEPECGEGYSFINNSPSPKNFGYVEAWKEFKNHMTSRGYEPINRYPVVARWRDDTDFVQGSIYNFQPHVVSGETDPPAEELVVPQPSLRFNDVENVGVTGRHYVLHNHIGQTCFKREDYDQDRYFKDMFEFVTQVLEIPKSELVVHEDSWGGGGNLGASMEFFVGGLELLNQVYMFYETEGDSYEELELKVLDMGMGQERISWITQATETSYQAAFPEAVEYLESKTDVDTENSLWKKFLPYSSRLNADEVEDIEQVWQDIASEIGVDKETLKQTVNPITDMYAVAEHSRALLFPLADGMIPGSSGGGHNLRVVYRRMMDIINRQDWDVSIRELMKIHSKSLEPMFPDLKSKLGQVNRILEAEQQKYFKNQEEMSKKLDGIENPSNEQLRVLYESHGVTPAKMEEHGLEVPENFYSMIAAAGDDETGQKESRESLHEAFGPVESTKKLYYIDQELGEFSSTVAKVDGTKVALKETCFYPTGGGQENDTGYIRFDGKKYEVEDVSEENGVVIHDIEEEPGFEQGDEVYGEIDWDRRLQLMQHHTSTHMVHAAARKVLGDHVYQAGAHKSPSSARLDITHFNSITEEQKQEIEHQVRKFQMQDHTVNVKNMDRSEAESQYGFDIYQGGAPPGNQVRLVEIEEVDIEACGGTHLEKTGAVNSFVITNTKRVQDGVDRIRFKAGEAAENYIDELKNIANQISSEIDADLEHTHRDFIREAEDLFSVDRQKLLETVKSFQKDIERNNHRIRKISRFLGVSPKAHVAEGDTALEKVKSIYQTRKESEKDLESLESDIESELRNRMEDRRLDVEIPTDNVSLLIQVARKLAREYPAAVVLEAEPGVIAASNTEESAQEMIERKGYSNVQGDDDFAKHFFD